MATVNTTRPLVMVLLVTLLQVYLQKQVRDEKSQASCYKPQGQKILIWPGSWLIRVRKQLPPGDIIFEKKSQIR